MTGRAPAQRAGILCADPAFGRFVAARLGLANAVSVSAAAEFLRRECRIDSRRDLNTDNDTRARFAGLYTDFDAWRGCIAAPR